MADLNAGLLRAAIECDRMATRHDNCEDVDAARVIRCVAANIRALIRTPTDAVPENDAKANA